MTGLQFYLKDTQHCTLLNYLGGSGEKLLVRETNLITQDSREITRLATISQNTPIQNQFLPQKNEHGIKYFTLK